METGGKKTKGGEMVNGSGEVHNDEAVKVINADNNLERDMARNGVPGPEPVLDEDSERVIRKRGTLSSANIRTADKVIEGNIAKDVLNIQGDAAENDALIG